MSGLVLEARAPDGAFTLVDFKLALCFRHVLWAFGFVSLVRSRRLTRAGMRVQGEDDRPPARRERPALARLRRH